MKKIIHCHKTFYVLIFFCFGFVSNIRAQCLPNLGSLSNYVLYTSVGGIGNTGTSIIRGNIGTNLGLVTGFQPPSVVYGFTHIANTETSQAASDLMSAYNELNALPPTNTNHAPAFGGETLTPGVYAIGGAGSIAGTLSLDGQGNPNAIFVFKIDGVFTVGIASAITLTNGTKASNVFWLINGAVSVAASTTIRGTIIANGVLSMADGGMLYGRLLSTVGAIAISNLTSHSDGLETYNAVGGFLSSNQTICSGSSPTDVILSGNTGNVINWESSSDAAFTSPTTIASTATSLTSAFMGTLTATTYFRAVVQSGACSIANSAYVTINVNPILAASVSIATSATTICVGSNVTFTATPTNGGTTPTYQWKVNGTNVTGQTATTFSTNTISNNDVVTVVMTSNASCVTGSPATSNSITETVNSYLPASASIATSASTLCTGSSVTFTATPTNGGTSPSYQWKVNGTNVSGQTAATFINTTLFNYDVVTVVMTSNASCVTGSPATSNSITETVNARPTSAISGTQFICNGATSGNISIALTGAQPWSLTYTDGTTPVNVTGITSSPYTFTVSPSSTKTYTVSDLSDANCTSQSGDRTGSAVVTVNAAFTSGAINTTGETICNGGTPVTTIGSVTAASGGDSAIMYSWRSSADSYTAAISGATSATYLPPSGLTTTTSYRRYANDGTCNTTPTVSSGTWTITVEVTTVGGTVSSNQTICSGTQPSDLTLSGHTGSVVKWESSLDVGFTSPTDIFVNSTTLTGATIGNLTQDMYFRAIVQNGSCSIEESSSVLISVDDVPVAGTVTGGTAICAGSTSGLLTLLGHTGSINRWEYSVSPFTSWTTISNTTTTYTSGTLTQATQFRAVIQNGVCPEVYSVATSVDINTTTWSSGSWSNGAPDSSTAAVIASSYTSTGNIDACSLTVNNGATVVISSGDTVILSGSLTANAGSFVTFNNNANLIQSGSTNTNSGAIIIKRDSSFLKRLDYTLWSSPVANQKLKAFSPGTLDTRFYTYNTQTIVSPATAANIYVAVPNPSTTNFDTAKGYLIRVPNTHSTTGAILTGSFTGVPNNGNYSYTLVNGGAGQQFNSVGNPYPSPIDAVAFVNNSTNFANTTATLYFWRKTNNSANLSYSIWNEALGYLNPNGEASGNNFFLNQVINVGQGFFVEASGSATSLVFENSMRIDNHDNQFFKSSPTTTSSIERNRIWLKAFNSSGLTTQTLLGYVTNATLSVDKGIDGRDVNDGDLTLSTLIGTVPYAIQGRPVPFDASDVVPLNFKVTTAGNYSIAIDHVDGIFTGGAQSIYLKDNLTTTIHDLISPYSFASEAGTFTNRFEIIYSLPLGTENPIFTANNVVIYSQNNEFVVNTGNVVMSSVKVFDVRGRLLEERKNVNSSQTTIGSGLANQVLLVQITSEDGVTVTRKVIR